ncbi:unnamed protein product [Adineta steineri]|uniref:RCC1-like domain-containing protein n=1 Tax=Adineta steineri TaxID=433720 RepID=A0A818JCZ7_9BILA|nr:unnamed protein product [Adineta steineri]CAF3537357.1 unnamed protein product [Adineta steineri]
MPASTRTKAARSSPKSKQTPVVKSKKRTLEEDNDQHDDTHNGDTQPQKRTKPAPEVVHITNGHSTKIKPRAKTPSASSVINVSFPAFSLSTAGQVLAVGENGMAQLGLKSAISQRQNPQPVPLPELVIQIACGPLHSVCLTEKNQIFTFGCNDEHALGRVDNDDDDDDEADQFGLVDMSGVMDVNQEKIIQLVAGDSHTLVLSDAGKVYGWGTFRSSTTGVYGLVQKGVMAKSLVEIILPEKIVKLASGYDFVLFLSETGHVYSCGNGETGQLARLNRYAAEDGLRGGIDRLIRPAPIIYNRIGIKAKNLLFDDIFTGSHHFFLKVHGHDWILGGGLNNFNQLGLPVDEPVYFPTFIPSLEGKKWTKFSGGLHHTLGLTADGEVYAMGRHHEGQLGIDQLTTHLSQPTLIPNLSNIIDISCGNHVSFVIDRSGKVFSFGAGTSLQCGHGQEDIKIPRMMSSKFMDIKMITNIAVGAQHTLFLTHDNPNKDEN